MRVLALVCLVWLVGCGLIQPREMDEFVGYATEDECLRDKALYESFGSVVELFHPISIIKKAVLETSLAPCVVATSAYRQLHGIADPFDLQHRYPALR